jgi:DNA-binding NarL/FixJ family response regulator
MPNAKSVIVVDDDVFARGHLRLFCEMIGFKVVAQTGDPHDARDAIIDLQPDYVLMDVRLEADIDGVDVALIVHEKAPRTKVVFVTGSTEQITYDRIQSDHPHGVLFKPVFIDDLRASLN